MEEVSHLEKNPLFVRMEKRKLPHQHLTPKENGNFDLASTSIRERATHVGAFKRIHFVFLEAERKLKCFLFPPAISLKAILCDVKTRTTILEDDLHCSPFKR